MRLCAHTSMHNKCNAFDLRIHRKSLKNRSLHVSPGHDPTKAEILQTIIRYQSYENVNLVEDR